MLTIIAYIRYTHLHSLKSYLLVILLLSLGLLAKPMLVTLPLILLLLDYWPLNRLKIKEQNQLSLTRLIIEKIPLFLISICSMVITYMVQIGSDTIIREQMFPFKFRLANALVSYVSYIIKTFNPDNLAPLYPLSFDGLGIFKPIIALIILSAITAVVIHQRNIRRYLLVGWLWYLIMLLPVIGLVQVGVGAMADRYTYLPSIGLVIMLTWTVTEFFPKSKSGNITLKILALSILLVLSLHTKCQTRYWQNDLALFGRAVEVTENNYVMHNNYGVALATAGRFNEALAQFEEVLKINPGFLRARLHIGAVLRRQGKPDRAIESFNLILSQRNDWPDVYNELGRAYALKGQYKIAIEKYKKVPQCDANLS